jgi:hypothetical protein
MNKILNILAKYTALLLMTLLSFYIYAHIIETIFNSDLPYVRAVEKTDSPNLLSNLKSANLPKNDSERYGFFGKPSTLRIGRLNYYASLYEIATLEDEWTLRRNTVGILTYQRGKAGRMGDSVLYSTASSSSLNILGSLVEGDRLIIDTDANWRYLYRVNKKITVDKDKGYLVAESPQNKIIIIKEVPLSSNVIVVEATYLTMEDRSL